MTPTVARVFLAFAIPFLGSMVSDLRKFINVRKDAAAAGKPPPPYDWALAGAAALEGGITGLVTGLTVSVIP